MTHRGPFQPRTFCDSVNARKEPVVERGLGTVWCTGLCCTRVVQGNKFAGSNVNAFPPHCLVGCYPPDCELQHLSPKGFLSLSNVTKEKPALSCAMLLAQYCVSTCHGRSGLLAASSYFTLKSQAVLGTERGEDLLCRMRSVPDGQDFSC